MVDEVVPLSDVHDAASKKINKLTKIPAYAYQSAKHNMRRDFLERVQRNREKDVEMFVRLAQSDKVQNILAQYLKSLSKKAKKPAS